MSKLEAAGLEAAANMVRLWSQDIFDPKIGSTEPRAPYCLKQIEQIIKANGWSWALPYRGDGPPQWCGMTAGYAWYLAGLDPSWLATYFASTYRLMLWATYQNFDRKGKQNPKPEKPESIRVYFNLRQFQTMPLSLKPRAGDIIIVGDGNPSVGDHVTMCIGWDESSRTFDTISGNGGGLGPNGDSRQGISRRNYRIGQIGYAPMFLIRPSESDLV